MKLAPVSNCSGRAALTGNSPLDRLVRDLAEQDFSWSCGGAIEAILRATQVTESDLMPLLLIAPGRYTRNSIYRHADFEVVALYWPAGARSPIHDHGGSRGFVKVVSGSLVSDEYALVSGGREAGPAELIHDRTQTLCAGDIDMRTPVVDIHRFAAPGTAAITLHIYTKPLDHYLVFDPEAKTCRNARSRYDERAN